MKILSFILGAALIAGGVYCLSTPLATFATLGWIVGLAMIIEGIGSIVTWYQRRVLGLADGWTLAGAIVSIILGGFIVGSTAFQFAVDTFIVYLVAAWLIVSGAMRIIAAFKLRAVHQTGLELGKHWAWVLIAGILIVVMGIICLGHPMFTAISIGVLIGISLIVTGCGIIAIALSVD
ncbi:MAG: DUF308 domain-containing protein [Coriobacteriales bacterium]|nr:DUF308 domain-containing protein [Coriobacteriales bacterium]